MYFLSRTTNAHNFRIKLFPSNWTHCFHLSILLFQVCASIINSPNLFLSLSGIYPANDFRLQFHFHPMMGKKDLTVMGTAFVSFQFKASSDSAKKWFVLNLPSVLQLTMVLKHLIQPTHFSLGRIKLILNTSKINTEMKCAVL
jgi:hypothetical protein